MTNDQWTYQYMDVNYACTIAAFHEDDVIKQDCHIAICELVARRKANGELESNLPFGSPWTIEVTSHWADITPYCVSRELVELYIRAGLPERQGTAPWNIESLNRHMQEQIREEQL
tara:strand:- start:487 stop:834 length:348 start_codon:yes stop_codon:yes gene_type:complete